MARARSTSSPHGIGLQELLQAGADGHRRRGRDGQRRYHEHPFPGEPERLPARGEQPQSRGGREQLANDGRDQGEDVLAVVQDEEQAAIGEVRGELVLGRAGGLVRDAQPGQHRTGDRGAVGAQVEITERDEPDAVRVGLVDRPGHLQSDPGLADPTRAGQRDQPGPAQRCFGRGDLRDAADARVDRSWGSRHGPSPRRGGLPVGRRGLVRRAVPCARDRAILTGAVRRVHQTSDAAAPGARVGRAQHEGAGRRHT